MKDFLLVVFFFAIVASVLLGIWWEAFPFWKVIGTMVVFAILYNIFKPTKK
jgi:hypothetical protein